MNQYIITEGQLSFLEQSPFNLDELENKKVSAVVRSHPYNPQAEHHCGECAYFAYANTNIPTTEKMIDYLKNIIKCNGRWENLEPYYKGVNAACEDAIAKLREGKGGE